MDITLASGARNPSSNLGKGVEAFHIVPPLPALTIVRLDLVMVLARQGVVMFHIVPPLPALVNSLHSASFCCDVDMCSDGSNDGAKTD